jgi:CobQ-like glutamine amidotransferase family enzyme
MHGPLLPKNPKVADYIIYKSLSKEYKDITLSSLLPLDDTLENQAKNVMIKRITN